MSNSVFVFDLDGTLADCSHRLHHINKWPPDWPSFFEACVDDPPIKWTLKLARRMQNYGQLLILTGRGNAYQIQTESWIREHLRHFALAMRESRDFRKDVVVKPELLTTYLSLMSERGVPPTVEFIVEDRDEMTAEWRRLGYHVLHVGSHDGASLVSKRMENGEHDAK